MSNYNDDDVDLLEILRNFALYGGGILVLFSIWFSWDGLDQSITGDNPNYSLVAKFIGAVLATIMTLVQFIYHIAYDELNKDLKLTGLISYVYSIWTNYLGIFHIFGFDPITTSILAGVMDILPESLIAFGLRAKMDGGVVDNIIKGITGRRGKMKMGSKQFQQSSKQPLYTSSQDTQPKMQAPQHGKGREHWERERSKQKDKPNRFAGFGE